MIDMAKVIDEFSIKQYKFLTLDQMDMPQETTANTSSMAKRLMSSPYMIFPAVLLLFQMIASFGKTVEFEISKQEKYR